MNSGSVRIIACPRCRKSTPYSPENPFRPFCSKLCKLEDIGAWAHDEYRVAGEPITDESKLEQLQQADED